ncbi:hypothetical protein HPP92_020581 [Vanilla planifolia]|uniref:Uncharacterized protein n=1 Tax=Vanilla planifolia TaxID=51239 RepID=A0A835UK08_VANPL|nr:hypothetical protein HPP92_020581 [Vanilla planifolia]
MIAVAFGYLDYLLQQLLKICFMEMQMEELVDERGATTMIVEAVWEVIRGLEIGAFEEVKNWVRLMKDYVKMRVLTVVGSPKLGLYEMGFGWARPTKVELVSIGKTRAFLLVDSREVDGGIKVGIALLI